jgi:hypothetical protein
VKTELKNNKLITKNQVKKTKPVENPFLAFKLELSEELFS